MSAEQKATQPSRLPLQRRDSPCSLKLWQKRHRVLRPGQFEAAEVAPCPHRPREPRFLRLRRRHPSIQAMLSLGPQQTALQSHPRARPAPFPPRLPRAEALPSS